MCIRDSLGISAARLKAEMKKGLDFTQATTKIVEEELKKQGDLSLTSADKATQASVKWENAQLKIGNGLKWLSDKWNEFSGNVADAVGNMAGDSRTASQVFDDQNKRVADLNINILPLIKKYDTLKEDVYKRQEVFSWLESWQKNGIESSYTDFGRNVIRHFYTFYDYFTKHRFSIGSQFGFGLPITGLELVENLSLIHI